jgi:hypothetical protein
LEWICCVLVVKQQKHKKLVERLGYKQKAWLGKTLFNNGL